MDSEPRVVAEAISAAGATAALVNVLGQAMSQLPDEKSSDRKSQVKTLVRRLKNISTNYMLSSGHDLPADVEERSNQLLTTAEELVKNLSSNMLRRGYDKLRHKGFDKRIGKLRTGIDDIDDALKLPAYLNQVGPAMSQQHQIPAAAAAPSPAQRPGPTIIFNQPCHITVNCVPGQAPGFNLPGQIPHQAAPTGNPPPDYPPIGYPLTGSLQTA